MLGFYELAAYGAIHTRCCPDAKPARAPAAPEICKPNVEEGVLAITHAVGGTDAALDGAISDFDKAIRCIARANQSDVFGGHPRPSGGEATILKKILGRLKP